MLAFYISLKAILFYISLIRMDTPGKSGNGIGWNASGLVGIGSLVHKQNIDYEGDVPRDVYLIDTLEVKDMQGRGQRELSTHLRL